MEHHRAQKIFNLKSDYEIETLNKNFRLLSKKYHPDMNPERPGWAHDQMILINEAYSILLKRLSSRTATEKTETESHIKPQRPKESLDLENDFNHSFHISMEYFLSGLWLFYLYGLENPHLRHEGTRRFRYRECYNLIEKALHLLLPLREYELSGDEASIFQTYYHFVLLFFNDLSKRWEPLPDIKINLSFQKDIKIIHGYIKKCLVPELMDYSNKRIKNEEIVYTLASLKSLKGKTTDPRIHSEIDRITRFATVFFDLLDVKRRGILDLEI